MAYLQTPSFLVEEIFIDDEDWLVLSIGFVSAQNPQDCLHIACDKTKPTDAVSVYLERTDQSLSLTVEFLQ